MFGLKNKKKAIVITLGSAGIVASSICLGNLYLMYKIHSEIENVVFDSKSIIKDYDVTYTYDLSKFILLQSTGDLSIKSKKNNNQFRFHVNTYGGLNGINGAITADKNEILQKYQEQYGIDTLNLEISANKAKINFTTATGKTSKIVFNDNESNITTPKLMGTVVYKYNETLSQLALTLGASDANLRIAGIPDAEFKLKDFTYTVPLMSLLGNSENQRKFSYTTAKRAEYNQQFVISDIKYQYKKEPGAKEESNKLSFYIGPNTQVGSVRLEGKNKPLGANESLDKFEGNYKLTLNGQAFIEGHNPTMDVLIQSGLLKRHDQTTITTDISAQNNKILFNGKDIAQTFAKQMPNFNLPMLNRSTNEAFKATGNEKSSPIISGK